jgi:hypothetical protein
MEKFILYGEKGSYRITTTKNYNSYIQDRREIMDFSSFDGVPEILEYIAMYSAIPSNNIIIIAK